MPNKVTHYIHLFLVLIFKTTQNEPIPFLPGDLLNICSHLNIPNDYSHAHWVMQLFPIFHILKISHDHNSLSLYLLHIQIDPAFQKETPQSPTHIQHLLVSQVLIICFLDLSSDRHRPLVVYSFVVFLPNRPEAPGRQDPTLFLVFQLHAPCFVHNIDLINNC